jgi:hypothetical protein
MVLQLFLNQWVIIRGPSWSWSYASWIYNYLCNQCLSPLSYEFEPRSWGGVLDTTLCDKVCQWLAIGGEISPATPVSSTNKTDRHDIAEILLKVALKHHKPTKLSQHYNAWWQWAALEVMHGRPVPRIWKTLYLGMIINSILPEYNWK